MRYYSRNKRMLQLVLILIACLIAVYGSVVLMDFYNYTPAKYKLYFFDTTNIITNINIDTNTEYRFHTKHLTN